MSAIFTVKTCPGYDDTPLRYGLIHSAKPENSHSKSPIVFVPGLGGSVKFAVNFLKRFVPQYGPVFALDARGFGLNEQVSPKPNPASYLQDFDRFMQFLQDEGHLPEDTSPIIMGLSLGGVYTTLYTTERKHPFKGVVLIAPAFKPNPNLFTPSFKLKSYASIFTKGPGAWITMPYGVQDLTRNPDMYDDPNFKDPLTLPIFYLFLVDRLCGKAFNKTRQIKVPTAIVVPENDLICDPNAMRAACERCGSSAKTLFTYPSVYHDVMLEPEEDQDRIYADLCQWLETLNESGNIIQSRPAG